MSVGFSGEELRERLRRTLPKGAYYALGTLRRSPATLRDRVSSVGRQRRRIRRAITGSGGWIVQSGPFAGMTFLRTSSWAGDIPAKLLGSYETELHEALEALLKHPYRVVLNIGCAEGYYAVGLARRLPGAHVVAVDIDSRATFLCERLARMNGVGDRVEVIVDRNGGYLGRVLGDGPALVVVDCEGCETALLDPVATPALTQADLLVELHDFVDPTISHTIVTRFAPTHDLTLVETSTRDPADHAALTGLDPADRVEALAEHRPGRMQWAVLRARRT